MTIPPPSPQVVREWVGIRPYRHRVRVERHDVVTRDGRSVPVRGVVPGPGLTLISIHWIYNIVTIIYWLTAL